MGLPKYSLSVFSFSAIQKTVNPNFTSSDQMLLASPGHVSVSGASV